MTPILHAGYFRWMDANLVLHCLPVPDWTPLYASEAAAFQDLTEKHSGTPADWSKDL